MRQFVQCGTGRRTASNHLTFTVMLVAAVLPAASKALQRVIHPRRVVGFPFPGVGRPSPRAEQLVVYVELDSRHPDVVACAYRNFDLAFDAISVLGVGEPDSRRSSIAARPHGDRDRHAR